jgi:hypothetical protein
LRPRINEDIVIANDINQPIKAYYPKEKTTNATKSNRKKMKEGKEDHFGEASKTSIWPPYTCI